MTVCRVSCWEHRCCLLIRDSVFQNDRCYMVEVDQSCKCNQFCRLFRLKRAVLPFSMQRIMTGEWYNGANLHFWQVDGDEVIHCRRVTHDINSEC